MSWVHIAEGEMLDSLNHLHSEVVFNAATTIAQRQDITVDEVEKLLDLIEREVTSLLCLEETKSSGRMPDRC